MRIIILGKRLAALCLLIAFALPLSQCSLQQNNHLKQSSSGDTASKIDVGTESQSLPLSISRNSTPPSDGVTYAFRSDHQGSLFTLANILAFLWPTIFVVIIFLRPALEQHLSIRLTELVLCLASGIVLLRLTGFGSILLGGYLAWFGLGLYATLSLFSFLHRVRQTWNLQPAP